MHTRIVLFITLVLALALSLSLKASIQEGGGSPGTSFSEMFNGVAFSPD